MNQADIDPEAWLDVAANATREQVKQALSTTASSEQRLALLLSDAAAPFLEFMAQRARAITRRHFGRTIQLYVPLYLSNWCSGGCTYCGFAADRDTPRNALTIDQAQDEMQALKNQGFEELLLLTGERSKHADFNYLRNSVSEAAKLFHKVTVEVFPMEEQEYAQLVDAGCTGVTLYQETYHPERYKQLHRWGPKSNYTARLQAPDRLLNAGMRNVGLGALLGLSDPIYDMLALFRHATYLRKKYWKAGVTISFPRIRPQTGGYEPEYPVDEKRLAQIIFAFRLCMPDVPLVLSTREAAPFRDGIAGLGINKMSSASKTTVGGYSHDADQDSSQFSVSDDRDTETFCTAMRDHQLEPVFKNWDGTYRSPSQ